MILEKIHEQHPCMYCLIKTICRYNFCEEYSNYYHLWKERAETVIFESIDVQTQNYKVKYDVLSNHLTEYWYIMSKFINIPGRFKTVYIGEHYDYTFSETLYRKLFFQYIN